MAVIQLYDGICRRCGAIYRGNVDELEPLLSGHIVREHPEFTTDYAAMSRIIRIEPVVGAEVREEVLV
jgi:hypothetical protein